MENASVMSAVAITMLTGTPADAAPARSIGIQDSGMRTD